MLSVARWIRISPWRNRILAANAPIPPFDNEFSSALFMESLSRGIDRLALSSVNASGSTSIVTLLGPLIVFSVDSPIASFAHATSLLSGSDLRNLDPFVIGFTHRALRSDFLRNWESEIAKIGA
jgi:hypothetical protein